MRIELVAATFAVAMAAPAFAQSGTAADPAFPGHQPSSNTASNILPSDTHTTYAPQLPAPPLGADATPMQFLQQAQLALGKRHTGEAQEALERAETRLLDRSTRPSAANAADSKPAIRLIAQARDALGRNDLPAAQAAIAQAMRAPAVVRGANPPKPV